jgi:hypothetical protein
MIPRPEHDYHDRMYERRLWEYWFDTQFRTSEVSKWNTFSWLCLTTAEPNSEPLSVTKIQESGFLPGSHTFVNECLTTCEYLGLVVSNDAYKYRRYTINRPNVKKLLQRFWQNQIAYDEAKERGDMNANEFDEHSSRALTGMSDQEHWDKCRETMKYYRSESEPRFLEFNISYQANRLLGTDENEDGWFGGMSGTKLRTAHDRLRVMYQDRYNIYYDILWDYKPQTQLTTTFDMLRDMRYEEERNIDQIRI